MSDGSPYDEFECGCGSANCRRRITVYDWQRPELQLRYAGYFSPYLQRHIERMQQEQARLSRNGRSPDSIYAVSQKGAWTRSWINAIHWPIRR